VLQGGGEGEGASGDGGGGDSAGEDGGSETDAEAGGRGAGAYKLPSETGAGGDGGPDVGGGKGEKVTDFDSALESLNQVAALLLDHKGREADLRQQINRNAQELQQSAANHDKQVLTLRKALEVSAMS
jgi:hypothetical protein